MMIRALKDSFLILIKLWNYLKFYCAKLKKWWDMWNKLPTLPKKRTARKIWPKKEPPVLEWGQKNAKKRRHRVKWTEETKEERKGDPATYKTYLGKDYRSPW